MKRIILAVYLILIACGGGGGGGGTLAAQPVPPADDTSLIATPFCGDGKVQTYTVTLTDDQGVVTVEVHEEGCDDGNRDDTDACPNDCNIQVLSSEILP